MIVATQSEAKLENIAEIKIEGLKLRALSPNTFSNLEVYDYYYAFTFALL